MKPDIKRLKHCRRLAVMGGTFDPIHYGHLAAAEAVRHAYKPDLVLFVPSGLPPHKDGAQVTPAEHRYRMTLLATAAHPCFEVTRMELDRPGPSYTVDTLRALHAQCAEGAELIFITGADTPGEIATWKDAEALLQLCRFAVVTRPGYDNAAALAHMDELESRYKADLCLLETPGVAVSGTELRERVAQSQPVRYLLPDAVERYIEQHGLYKHGASPAGLSVQDRRSPNLENLKRRLSECLSAERYAHTLGVAEEAEKLARHYGVDVGKARLAALLHDCAKEYGPEKKRVLCRLSGIALDEVTDAQIDLTHCALSAVAARDEYGVDDPDILQAIRCHTTGRGGMTLLDKIIMLADYIEPTREDYPGLSKMRALAYTDINGALRVGIREVMALNKKRGRLIHPDSREALKSLKKLKI